MSKLTPEALTHQRHSLAHLLAAAVLEIWPDAKRAIGPAIDDGFYYDFAFSAPISETDFPTIETKMKEILPTWPGFIREEVSADQARSAFPNNPYKQELINDFSKDGQTLTLYRSGSYVDLCRGGHSDSFAKIDPNSFKLTKLAGAYWRGDEKRDQLTRIYAVAFETAAELQQHLAMLEEAKKRDHRKLGKELGLFTFSELVGPGLPLWTPRGTIMRELLNDYVWWLRKKHGYQKVTIPHITKKDLYETSGHWAKYAADLFKIETREGHTFAMKPMNCPHHAQIFDSEPHSYRDMPVRYCETTMVYRDEQHGELSGLQRVLSITQDDAHVFCRLNQMRTEAEKVWNIIETFYQTFGFKLTTRLSRRDPDDAEKYLGKIEDWDMAELELKNILEDHKMDWIDGLGEAAFYGPKIDFMTNDSLGRTWQVATIQLDFVQPTNFELTCVNEKGEKEPIVMIHCAIMGSIERFMSIMIEHYAGAFPFWLAPEQIRVATVSEDYLVGAKALVDQLCTAGLRAHLDSTAEKVGKKVREAATMKVPWTIVYGAKEAAGEPIQIKVFGEEAALIVSAQDLVASALEAGKK